MAEGAAGLTVSVEEAMQAAALRYFESDGAFAAAVRELTGVALPQVLHAAVSGNGQYTLAWRSPTETLALTPSTARMLVLEEKLAAATDGCLVNLSGGLKVLRVMGERVSDLLCRLGGSACVPAVGEARRSRLADVPVLALCVRSTETLLVVDRAYAEHLMGWIRETLLDFAPA
ncbi:MAG TPA: sarcosine oxidase subunit gamma family protein [Steroidobacteraceae bacterium]